MGTYPAELLTLLAELSKTFDSAYGKGEKELQHFAPITITVTFHDEHIATLYEDGWDFSQSLDKDSQG